MKRWIKHPGQQVGFTLIEVMVALTVVAVTLPALLFLLSQQIDGTAYLRDRSVAQWVAADRGCTARVSCSPLHPNRQPQMRPP